jgi:peptidoglycan/xylan/chitin deacetylase (PgdA/CDA1 family)
MTWSELRSCEGRGIRFGAHTRTHPILSRLSESRSREEIAGSASRLAEQASSPSRVFCYPNGRPEDFGEREVEILRDLDFRGAVTASQGYAAQGRLDEDTTARFCVPRFSFPQTLLELLQLVTGFERFKSLVRSE